MDLGSILLILALLILVALFVSWPFFDRGRQRHDRLPGTMDEPSTDAREHELSALMAERDRVINALQELDFDNALGKIPQEDYPPQRLALLQHGSAVLRRLDELQAFETSSEAEARIEEVLAARRLGAATAGAASADLQAAGPAPALAAADDDLEILLAKRRRSRQEKAAGFCPQCGSPVQRSDRFCPKCGKTLA
jgi:hypothetical protein